MFKYYIKLNQILNVVYNYPEVMEIKFVIFE